MNSQIYSIQARRRLALDGVRRTPSSTQSTPPQATTSLIKRTYHAKHPASPKRSYWQKLQLPLLLVAGAMGGFFAETMTVGLAMLAIYAVIAFLNRIPSRTTFTLALLLLTAIACMLLIKPSMGLIGNFSSYAFVLLLIGSITLGKEAKLPKRTRRKYRR